jgi:hypothetical protein
MKHFSKFNASIHMRLAAMATVVVAIEAVLPFCAAGQGAQSVSNADGIEFFEKRVRPLLVESCYECHSEGKKTKGGLRLDTREGWAKGGDTGPALIPGEPERSLIVKAVRYDDPDLKMPPKKRLTPEAVATLEQWIKIGAPDPRAGESTAVVKKSGLSVAEGRKFWSYQPPRKNAPPQVRDTAWPRTDIDRFILAGLETRGLRPSPDASRATLIRRVYYDLIGLPPSPEDIDAFARDTTPEAFAKVVDHLLASPQFGERWGRHWLDVARFAESITLRGFVFKEAWRYRDYVIEAFNQDRPFNRFMAEQVSGDLMPHGSYEEHRRQLVATTFLALGNTNLEEQDKGQLRMDVVDEQLDTIGKAFLAQTIGCARCHDHKFDPIPTRDYYAMAGILRNTKTMIHANVSNWIEMPLPVPPTEEALFAERDAAIAALQARIKDAKARSGKLASAGGKAAASSSSTNGILAVKNLPGVVVDDSQAKKVGEWKQSRFSSNFVGDGYLHDLATGKGDKTLTFIPELPHAGKYEVRFSFVPSSNRAEEVPVTVFSADGDMTIRVNEKESPPIDGRWISLGQHRFEQNGQGFVLVGTQGTKGHVIADAVQFIPVEMLDAQAAAKEVADVASLPPDARKAAQEAKKLEDELKKLTNSPPFRPRAMSVKEEDEIGDTQIHIRGSVHNLGENAPRGFLQVATYGTPPIVPAKQSGRLEFGEWLASPSNPLPSRVMANRAWNWLFGTGLVRTTDNFGTTGETPSHPELLDYLAVRFVELNWSVKSLVRQIVLSRAYQQSSSSEPARVAVDPENRLFWRMNRRRLDAECIRDTMLAVSGQLKLDVGGSNIKAGTTADYAYKQSDTRRSVYSPVFRNSLPEFFEVFDFADSSVVMGRRNASTVAPQALFLMNHPSIIEQARAAAERALALPVAGDTERLERAYRMALGRSPSEGEARVAMKYLSRAPADGAVDSNRQQAWTAFFQALFASMDFRYVE